MVGSREEDADLGVAGSISLKNSIIRQAVHLREFLFTM
jgi:hypothetical protein